MAKVQKSPHKSPDLWGSIVCNNKGVMRLRQCGGQLFAVASGPNPRNFPEGSERYIDSIYNIKLGRDDANNHINQIGWIIKNSWDSSWGDNGFAYIYLDNSFLVRSYEIDGSIFSNVYSNANRLITDDDNDGYYVWGGGAKPSFLPIWVPEEQDGDDSNPTIGGMNDLGQHEILSETRNATWNLEYNYYVSQDEGIPLHNVIINEDVVFLVIGCDMTMADNSTITVRNGGILAVHYGSIANANIIVEPGGALSLENGIIFLRDGGKCRIDEGSHLQIQEGSIQ